MRKRPNKNWIDGIYILPKSCDHCKKPTFVWDSLVVELNKQICYCMDCAWNETIWEEEWNRYSHTYSQDEESNKYYNVKDMQLFENMIWEKVDRD